MKDAQFYDFIEVRMAIETVAVCLAVERATTKQADEPEQIHQSFLKAIQEKDLIQMIMLDELFHTKIIIYSKSQLLINISKQLLNAFRAYRGNSFTEEQVYSNAVKLHSRILLCLQIRNFQQAVIEMRKHPKIASQDMELIHTRKKAEKKISTDDSTAVTVEIFFFTKQDECSLKKHIYKLHKKAKYLVDLGFG